MLVYDITSLVSYLPDLIMILDVILILVLENNFASRLWVCTSTRPYWILKINA